MVAARFEIIGYYLTKTEEEFTVPKGKPWSHAQVKQLQELRNNGKTVAEIAQLMDKSSDAVKQKLRRLGLKVVTLENREGSTSTSSIWVSLCARHLMSKK